MGYTPEWCTKMQLINRLILNIDILENGHTVVWMMLIKSLYNHVGRSACQTSVWVHKKCTSSSEDFAADWSVSNPNSSRAVWKMRRLMEMEALLLLLSFLAFQVTLQLQSAKAGWIVKSSSNSSDSSDSWWRLLDNGTYVRVYGNQDAMGDSGIQGSSGGEGSDTRKNTDFGWVLSPRTGSSSYSRSFQQFRSSRTSRTVPSLTTHCEDYEEDCNNVGRTLGSSRKSVHERPRNSDGLQVKWSVFWAIWLKSQDP